MPPVVSLFSRCKNNTRRTATREMKRDLDIQEIVLRQNIETEKEKGKSCLVKWYAQKEIVDR